MKPLTVEARRALARGALWGSLAFNAIVMVADLVDGHARAGALMSVIVAVLAWWVQLAPRVEAWLDANCDTAIVSLRMAEQAHAEIVKHVRQGTAHFSVTGTRLN